LPDPNPGTVQTALTLDLGASPPQWAAPTLPGFCGFVAGAVNARLRQFRRSIGEFSAKPAPAASRPVNLVRDLFFALGIEHFSLDKNFS